MTDDERRTELVVLRDPGHAESGDGRGAPRSDQAGASGSGFDPRAHGGFDPRSGPGFDPRHAGGFDPRMAGVMLDPESLARAGMDLQRIQRALARRVRWFFGGVAIAIVGTFVDVTLWGLPAAAAVALPLLGGGVALGGLLGIRRGMGCLAQLVGTVFLFGVACGVGVTAPMTLQVLAVTLLALITAHLLLPRRPNDLALLGLDPRAMAGGGGGLGPFGAVAGPRAAGSSTRAAAGPRARGGVIDVDAHDTDGDDHEPR